MKSKDMTAYNRVLTDCLTSLVVVEPPLVNFYMYFTFSRTNVYDTTAVMGTFPSTTSLPFSSSSISFLAVLITHFLPLLLLLLETLGYIDVWFRELLRNDKRLSNDFDSSYFCKALSIMFETEHHQLILRVLTLLYNYADLFSGKITRKAVLIGIVFPFPCFLSFFSATSLNYCTIISSYLPPPPSSFSRSITQTIFLQNVSPLGIYNT
jgi:hypothetical protein